MRRVARWLCYTVLGGFALLAVVGFTSKEGVGGVVALVLFMAAFIGAMEL